MGMTAVEIEAWTKHHVLYVDISIAYHLNF